MVDDGVGRACTLSGGDGESGGVGDGDRVGDAGCGALTQTPSLTLKEKG